jgi:hypothetical protein
MNMSTNKEDRKKMPPRKTILLIAKRSRCAEETVSAWLSGQRTRPASDARIAEAIEKLGDDEQHPSHAA